MKKLIAISFLVLICAAVLPSQTVVINAPRVFEAPAGFTGNIVTLKVGGVTYFGVTSAAATFGTPLILTTPLGSTYGGLGASFAAAGAGIYPKSNGATPAVFAASTLAASGVGTPAACTNQFVTGFTLAGDSAPTSVCTSIVAGDLGTTLTPQFARIGVGVAAHATDLATITSIDTTASSKALNIAHSGAIVGTGYGAYVSKTGASTTNVGGYFSASGGTNNYGLLTVGNLGFNTILPVGAQQTKFTATTPIIFATGDTLGSYTSVTFPTANKDYANKTSICTTCAVGDLVIITAGTGAYTGQYTVLAKISNDSIQLNRTCHNEAGDIADGAVSIVGSPRFSVGANRTYHMASLSNATSNETAFRYDYTVNKAAGNATGLQINATHTLAPGTNKPFQVNVGATERISTSDTGNTTLSYGHLKFISEATPGAPTSNAPTGGGGCTDGSHVIATTFVTANGETQYGAVSAAQTCVLGTLTQTIPVSAIPTGTAGVTTGRNMCASKAGTVTPLYQVGAPPTIPDNTTLLYDFVTADAALTVACNATNTTTARFYRDGTLAGFLGTSSTAWGVNAGVGNTGANQTATGQSAGLNNTGGSQTATGDGAGLSNTGASQTAAGYGAGQNNTGANQTATGVTAGYYNTGASQTATGQSAGLSNTGAYQTAAGYGAGSGNTGASQTATGVNAGLSNTGANQTATGYAAGLSNNWPNVTRIGYSSSAYFPDDAGTLKNITEASITAANTITYVAHGFGTVGGKVNIRYLLTGGTAPVGLVTNTIYQFTVTSADVLTLAGIAFPAAAFTGTLNNSVNTGNSIAIGVDANPTKANQTVVGPSSITETLLRGNVITTQAAVPTLSACGTGTPAMEAGSTDHRGFFTTGAGVLTSCTMTFNIAYAVRPACSVYGDNAVAVVGLNWTTGTTTLVVQATSMTAQTFGYICQ